MSPNGGRGAGLRGRLGPWVDPWVGRWWRGEAGVPGALLSVVTWPAEGVYRLAVRTRATVWKRGLLEESVASLPVVSVGNLVVGGTGKTPVTSWIARRLQDRGCRPAILLRGYGRDEVLLHRRWTPDALVVSGVDRVRSAGEACRDGASVAVLDDGFQHRRLARDLDIVLVAAEHPFPGRLLPRGPYREPAGALERADLVVVTRRLADDATVERLLARIEPYARGRTGPVLKLAPAAWTTLAGETAAAPRGPLLAVTGVAGPELFREGVERAVGEPTSLMAYADHHDFGEDDVARIVREAGGRTLVVTEKDAVKLAALGGLPPSTRVLTLAVVPERGEEALERAFATVVALAQGAGTGDEHRGPPLAGGLGGTRERKGEG